MSTDPRIRMETENFRVVAPNAKLVGNRVYLNDDKLYVEKATKNSLGEQCWLPHLTVSYTKYTKRSADEDYLSTAGRDNALFVLLSNGAHHPSGE